MLCSYSRDMFLRMAVSVASILQCLFRSSCLIVPGLFLRDDAQELGPPACWISLVSLAQVEMMSRPVLPPKSALSKRFQIVFFEVS